MVWLRTLIVVAVSISHSLPKTAIHLFLAICKHSLTSLNSNPDVIVLPYLSLWIVFPADPLDFMSIFPLAVVFRFLTFKSRKGVIGDALQSVRRVNFDWKDACNSGRFRISRDFPYKIENAYSTLHNARLAL